MYFKAHKKRSFFDLPTPRLKSTLRLFEICLPLQIQTQKLTCAILNKISCRINNDANKQTAEDDSQMIDPAAIVFDQEDNLDYAEYEMFDDQDQYPLMMVNLLIIYIYRNITVKFVFYMSLDELG